MATNVLVIGAAGKVAQRFLSLLSKKDYHVVAFHRRPEQRKELEKKGATSVVNDLTTMSIEELSFLMVDIDVVVFSAGAGGASIDLTTAIDGIGLEKSVQAAEKAGVKRFILVSAYPKSWRDELNTPVMEHYMRVKKESDTYLTESSLDWVILRPVALSDDAGTGRIRAGLSVPNGHVRRDDVAAFMAAVVEKPDLSKRIIELVEGEDLINDALQHLL